MSDLIKKEPDNNTQKFERFVAMAPGEFWRFTGKKEIKHVQAGHVLLIAKIDDIDGAAHTLHIRYHPSVIPHVRSNEFKMRVDEFLDNFEFIDQASADVSRKQDIASIQAKLGEAQAELVNITTDVKTLDSRIAEEEREKNKGDVQLPMVIEQVSADIVSAIQTQKVSALMSPGLSATGVDQIKAGMKHQRDLTVKRADYITAQTRALSQIASEMTPFFEEMAATALSTSSDMMRHVDDLMKGIGTLNLYVLKNVEVEKIKEGKSADESIPLTIAQAIMYMDEEAVVHFDINDDFDCRDRSKFFEYLADSKLLQQQIFPSERCVVAMAATRTDKDYQNRQGASAMEAANLSIDNQTMYLVIKDGENISVVLSPEFWHQQTTRLFPSTDEVNAPFKGFDGSDITYDDIDYTKAVAKHDSLALKYKRLLVLLCGLDHNKRAFGDFYEGEPSLDFISMDFQEKHFNFIHDASGEGLISTTRPNGVNEWLRELNSEVATGSRIMIMPSRILTQDTIPSAYEKRNQWHYAMNREPSIQYSPETNEHGYLIGVVRTEKGRLVMDVKLSGDTRQYETRTFNSRIYIDEMLRLGSSSGFLNLDRLDPVDVDWYIQDRKSRALNVELIKLLKLAAHYSGIQRVSEKPTRDALLKALIDGDIAKGDAARLLVNKAVAKWNCANPKKDINTVLTSLKAFNGLCDQMYALTGKMKDVTPDILAMEKAAGRKLVRLSLLSDGKYCAYSEVCEAEKDDRMMAFAWVKRTRYTFSQNGLKALKSTFALLKKIVNEEMIMFESGDVKDYINESKPAFTKPEQKRALLDRVRSPNSLIAKLQAGKDNMQAFERLLVDYVRARREASNKYIVEPQCFIPFGMIARTYHEEENIHFIQIGMAAPSIDILIWMVKGCAQRTAKARDAFAASYVEKQKGAREFDEKLQALESVDGIFDATILSTIEGNGSGWLLEKAEHHKISRSKVAKYSHDQAVFGKLSENEKHNFWWHPDLAKGIDDYCGISKPNNFDVHVLRSTGFVSSDGISLFRLADVDDLKDISIGHHNSLSYYDTLEDALDENNFRKKYTCNSVKKIAVGTEIEPQTINGHKAIKSWEFDPKNEINA